MTRAVQDGYISTLPGIKRFTATQLARAHADSITNMDDLQAKIGQVIPIVKKVSGIVTHHNLHVCC